MQVIIFVCSIQFHCVFTLFCTGRLTHVCSTAIAILVRQCDYHLIHCFITSSYSILSFGAPAANKYKVIVDGRDPMLFETSQVCALFFHFLLAVSITLQSPLKPTRFAEPIQNQS